MLFKFNFAATLFIFPLVLASHSDMTSINLGDIMLHRHIRFLIIIALSISFANQTQSQTQKNVEWENPSINSINREPMHNTLIPYESFEKAVAAKRNESKFYLSLNGMWKFNWVDKPDDRPIDFYKPECDVSGWKEISVLGNWQLQGYDVPIYLNSPYPFKKNPPFIQHDFIPVGSYRKEFEVPSDWNGRQIFLNFDGVESAFYVWVNGELIGYSEDSRLPAEFNITNYLKDEKNILAVEVYRWSDGSYLECQDFWRLSGIFRNVYLMAALNIHIRDFEIKTELDEKYLDTTLTVILRIFNYGMQPVEKTKIEIALLDENKIPVGSQVLLKGEKEYLFPNDETVFNLKTKITDPKKWSAEHTNLYTIVLTLSDKGGNVIEYESAKIGFRKSEIKVGLLLVNGKPILIKVVNNTTLV